MVNTIKKSANSEPTITDVMVAVQNLAETVQDLTEAVQTGFAKVEDRFDRVDERFNKLERRTVSLEEAVEEMNDTLQGVARAVDKDAVTSLEHERRIRVLEKATA